MNKKRNLSSPSRWRWGWLSLSVVLAVVFVVAGSTKVLYPTELEKAIWAYHVIPPRYAHWGSLILPWGELLVGGLLLWPRRRSVGAAGAILLLSLFTAAGILAWTQGFRPGCGCFGRVLEWGQEIGPTWLVRNLLFMVGAVALFLHSFLHPLREAVSQGSFSRMRKEVS